MVGCMQCFQLSENYVVFYVCHKSTSVFVSSVGSYCRVVFEVRCSMSWFKFCFLDCYDVYFCFVCQVF